MAGDDLLVDEDECMNSKRQPILKFSKSAIERLKDMETKSYKIKSAIVDFVIHWQKDGVENDIKIVLPKLYFVRAN